MNATALIIEVPESEPIVHSYRARFDKIAARGIPAHITILYPFMPLENITDSVECALRKIVTDNTKFTFHLAEWGKFDTALWLRPAPEIPFINLTETIFKRFPDYPPYDGKHNKIQPHLTVAQYEPQNSENTEWNRIRKSTKTSLPIACTASCLSIYTCDKTGYWKKHMSLPFSDIN